MTDNWKRVSVIVGAIGLMLSLTVNVATVIRNTPTKDDIKNSDDSQNIRLEFFIDLVQQDTKRIEDKLDNLIERHMEGGEGN